MRDKLSNPGGIAPLFNNLKRVSGYIEFRADYLNLISGDLSVLEGKENGWYVCEIVIYAYLKKDINLIPVLKKIADNPLIAANIRNYSVNVISLLQKESESDSDNQLPVSKLSGYRVPQTTEILKLLKKNNIEYRRTALYMIGKFRLTDLLYFVCDYLNIPGLTGDSYNVLRSFGADAEDELEKYYLNAAGNFRLCNTILLLLTESSVRKSGNFLFSRLWSNTRILKETASRSLVYCNFIPSDTEKTRLEQLITETIKEITWYLSAKISLEKNKITLLPGQIENECERLMAFLINILTITYESEKIKGVIENIRSNDPVKINSALKLLSLFVNSSVKIQLNALFSPSDDSSKYRKLSAFYPFEIKDHKTILVEIINRDYNLTGLLTKALALRSIKMIEGLEMAESLLALLFSSEQILFEEAASLIVRTNPGLYQTASARLTPGVRKRIDSIMDGTVDKEDLLFEKALFLNECFGRIGEEGLLYLAGELKYIKMHHDWKPETGNNYVIWPLQEKKYRKVQLLMALDQDLKAPTLTDKQYPLYYLKLQSVQDYHYLFRDESSEVLRYFDLIKD